MSETTIYFITPTSGASSGGTDNSFMIQPKTIDGPVVGSIRQNTDLVLYGNGAENWGEKFNQNFYRLIENFACKKAPNTGSNVRPMNAHDFDPSEVTTYGMYNGINSPLPGQLWYNTDDKTLHFYFGPGEYDWSELSSTEAVRTLSRSIQPPQDPTVYWDEIQNKPSSLTSFTVSLTGDATGTGTINLSQSGSLVLTCKVPGLNNLSLKDLTDIDVTNATAGQSLVFDGTSWSAATISSVRTSSSTISTPTTFAQLTGNPLDNTELATHLSDKQSIVTGGATSIAVDNLPASRILVSDENGKVATSDIASDTISYLANVSSDVQSQLDKTTTTTYVHNNGVGGSTQSFQTLVGCDVPTKRMVNVTYTNMTNNPIFVSILLCPTNTGKVTASLNVHESDVTKESAIDQVTGYCDNPFVPQTDCIVWTVNTTSSVSSVSLQGIVPPGYKYRCVTSDSVALLQTNLWRELR